METKKNYEVITHFDPMVVKGECLVGFSEETR